MNAVEIISVLIWLVLACTAFTILINPLWVKNTALKRAYKQGWLACAKWSDDLQPDGNKAHLDADVDLPAYLEDRKERIGI